MGSGLTGPAEDRRRDDDADGDILTGHGAGAHRGAVGGGDALRHGTGVTGGDDRGQDRGTGDGREVGGGPGPTGGALGLDEARDADGRGQQHGDDAERVDGPRAALVPPGAHGLLGSV